MAVPAIDLNQVPSRLRELVEEAARTGEIVLTSSGEAVAKIVPLRGARGPRRPGSARGLVHMVPDFDTTPDEFGGYL